MARFSQIFTITAGTPQQVATVPTFGDRWFAQMLKGGSGMGYVMDAPSGVTPHKTDSAHLVGQMGAATSTAPGGSLSDDQPGGGNFIDMSSLWIDGDNSGDTLLFTYNQR